MSVLDRVHRRQTEQRLALTTGSEAGQSSTPAVRPAVIQRLEFVVNTLHSYIEQNDDTGTIARFSFVTRALIEEMGEELADRDEETLQGFMAQIGEVIAWIGHGDNSRLPGQMQEFIEPQTEIEQAAS